MAGWHVARQWAAGVGAGRLLQASGIKMTSTFKRLVIYSDRIFSFWNYELRWGWWLGLGLALGYGRVWFRGRFRCQRIFDSWLSVRDSWGSGAGCRYWIHDHH